MELIIKKFKELTVEELYEIIKARVDIFVVEQNYPYRELDDKDKNSYHMFFKDEDSIAAYLRVVDRGVSFDEVSIGRVLTVKRGCGLGGKILAEGIKLAKEKLGAETIRIEAQTYAKGFYEKAGFEQSSAEFTLDGIPHMQMLLHT
ncbi:MAG: GNAT family N-acetyltransferase [Oscillospiraceae bacterium]|nr:GNAT family N-acetyltransferase [Oscillospiraceae bacterium]